MRRKSPVELEVNHDRWLVSYSDFVTLLFAFFVVMYSISQVNEGKYRVLSSTLTEAFSVPQSALSPIQVGSPTLSVSPSAIQTSDPESQNQSSQSTDPESFRDENLASLSELADAFTTQFSDLIDDNLLKVNANELWLEIELKDSILFPTASSFPSLQAKGIFEEVAQMMASHSNPIQVEGFTDDVPINNRQFSSNWELSAARSASVVKILANNGVAPQRLSAAGYGEFQPIAENNSAEGRAQNRRVVLMIARDRSLRPQIQDGSISEAIGVEAGDSSDRENEVLANGTEADQASQSENADQENQDIEPVRLQGGGLLFTSDPDLPRIVEVRSTSDENDLPSAATSLDQNTPNSLGEDGGVNE